MNNDNKVTKRNTNKIALLCLLFFGCFNVLYAQEVEVLVRKEGVSFRGISSFGNNQIWVSGSLGTVGRSIDAGNTWQWVSPSGYSEFDFRDIEVFSKNEAIIVSAGSPAVILRTEDAGQSWSEVYRDVRPAIFLDGMDFDGNHGFVLGDPIDGNFQLLETNDRGKTWNDVSSSTYLFADDGEAAFAASGSSLKLIGKDLYIGTGGITSNFFIRKAGKRLAVLKFPVSMIQGAASTGIFSIDCWDRKTIIAVGGDYLNDTVTTDAVVITRDGGLNWEKPITPISGFKSCVKYIDKDYLIATGTSGTDVSTDGGHNWKQISTEGFHCLTTNKSSTTVYLAGSDRIGKIVF